MKIAIKVLNIVLIVLLTTNYSIAQNSTITKAEKFHKLFSYAFENNMFNGSVLITENNKTIYKESFGDAGDKQKKSITSKSQFLLASLSKQFTATAVMLLEEQGKLNYEDKVIKYLPDFPYNNITIRHLLNQTSGIPEYESFLNKRFTFLKKNYEKSGKIITNKDVYELYKKNKPQLEFIPNEKFYYSNTNYVFLALLVEVISELSFSKYIDNQIFNNLKMKETFVHSKTNESNFSNRVYGYKLKIDGKTKEVNDNYPFINIVGDSGIYSTVDDMKKWIEALNNNVLLSKESINEAFSLPVLDDNNTGPYGFGWFVKTIPFNGHKALTHSGEYAGFSTAMFNDLKDKNSLVLLSNNSSKYRSQLNSIIVRIFYDIPYELPKINIKETISKIIFEKGIEAAINEYNKLQIENPKKYNFEENQLNKLGYDLLELDMLDEAIAVFKLNVSNYQESSNVYDSLGEAYLLNNQKELALLNYKKSILLDSDNTKAIDIIKKIQE